MTILDEIVARRRQRVAELRAAGYFRRWRATGRPWATIRDFEGALRPDRARHGTPGSAAASLRPRLGVLSASLRPGGPATGGPAGDPRDGARPSASAGARLAVIAEIKRASPSRGSLREDLDPAGLARRYEEGGAACLSVLTEPDYFRGSPEDLAAARAAVALPVLRKDFLVHPDQVFETRGMGADAALLIAAVLSRGELETMLGLAAELGLQCLVEVHDEGELARALEAGARLIGVNNRDLRTFRVDLAVTERLAPMVPPECTVVSESGVFSAADAARAAASGADAVLVGETLVRAADPAALVAELAVPLAARRGAAGVLAERGVRAGAHAL